MWQYHGMAVLWSRRLGRVGTVVLTLISSFTTPTVSIQQSIIIIFASLHFIIISKYQICGRGGGGGDGFMENHVMLSLLSNLNYPIASRTSIKRHPNRFCYNSGP